MSQPFEIIDPDVEARRKARADEYGQWECGTDAIMFDGARAFNEGDPVPKSTVERLSLDKLGAVVASGTFHKKTADAEAARVKATDDAIKARVKETEATTTTKSKGGNG